MASDIYESKIRLFKQIAYLFEVIFLEKRGIYNGNYTISLIFVIFVTFFLVEKGVICLCPVPFDLLGYLNCSKCSAANVQIHTYGALLYLALQQVRTRKYEIEALFLCVF